MCHLVNKLGLLDKSFNLLTILTFLPSNQFGSVHPVPVVFYFFITDAKPESVPVSTGQQVPYERLYQVKKSNIIKISKKKKKSGIHCNGSHVSAKISSSFVYSRPIVSVLITHIYRCGHSELLEVIRCSANRSAHLNHSYLSSPVPQP